MPSSADLGRGGRQSLGRSQTSLKEAECSDSSVWVAPRQVSTSPWEVSAVTMSTVTLLAKSGHLTVRLSLCGSRGGYDNSHPSTLSPLACPAGWMRLKVTVEFRPSDFALDPL